MDGMLYQGKNKEDIETILKDGIFTFTKKYGFKPDEILVNKGIELEIFDDIVIKKDKYMYSKNIIILLTEKRITMNE